jgi:hypothetical protein
MEQLGSHRTYFNEVWYPSIFRKSVERIQVSLKSVKDNGYCVRTCVIISYWIILRLRSVSEKKFVDKFNTHILCSITFREPCHLWHNVGEFGRGKQATDDDVIWRMRIACWLTKTTDIHSKCNTYWFSTATVVTRVCIKVAFVGTLPLLLFRAVYWGLGLGGSCENFTGLCYNIAEVMAASVV